MFNRKNSDASLSCRCPKWLRRVELEAVYISNFLPWDAYDAFLPMWAVFSRIFCSLGHFDRRRMNSLPVFTWTGLPNSLESTVVRSVVDPVILNCVEDMMVEYRLQRTKQAVEVGTWVSSYVHPCCKPNYIFLLTCTSELLKDCETTRSARVCEMLLWVQSATPNSSQKNESTTTFAGEEQCSFATCRHCFAYLHRSSSTWAVRHVRWQHDDEHSSKNGDSFRRPWMRFVTYKFLGNLGCKMAEQNILLCWQSDASSFASCFSNRFFEIWWLMATVQ